MRDFLSKIREQLESKSVRIGAAIVISVLAIVLLSLCSGANAADRFGVTAAKGIDHDTTLLALNYRRENGWGGWIGQWRHDVDEYGTSTVTTGTESRCKSTASATSTVTTTSRRSYSIQAIGADYEWRWKDLRATAGLAYLDETTPENGTKVNLWLTAAYSPPVLKPCSAVAMHGSHARILGIARDKANSGWNFLGASCWF